MQKPMQPSSLVTRTWYLSESGATSDSFCIPGAPLSASEAEEARLILGIARAQCGERFGGYRIRVEGLGRNGAHLYARGHRILTQQGPFHALREIPNIVPKLAGGEFSYDPWLQRLLLSPELNAGGLVLVSGSAGSGKSTTMAAALISRLQAYGSMAITLEDPPEYVLQGLHGQGNCLQLPATGPEDFAALLSDALRCYPAGSSAMMLMISEIRTAETAAVALEAALSGHLVVSSIHAAGIESCVARITTMAGQNLGSAVARADAAEALKVCIYQKRVGGSIRFTAMRNFGDVSIASKIREGQFHHLASDIQKQAASVA